MSTEDLRNLDASGCCQPQVTPTPEEITNRPGLPAIRYRVGSYASFRQAMVERSASIEVSDEDGMAWPLRDWTTRASDDYGIALLEMWAYLADILTFYQERIANEAFLRTAVLPESVRRLVALLDYEPAPGVAATSHLAFMLEMDKQVQIPIGLRVQSVPGQDEKPQKFETVEVMRALSELNRVRIFPEPEPDEPFRAGSTEGFLEPESASRVVEELSPGDRFVVFFRWRDGETEEKEVTALRSQQALAGLTWTPGIQSSARTSENSRAFKFTRKFRLFGFNAPTRYLHSAPDGSGGFEFTEIEEGEFKIGSDGSIEVDYTFDLPPIDSPGNKLYLDAVYDDLKKGARVLVPVRAQSSETAPDRSADSIPFYRLYSNTITDHFYTTSATERDEAISDGYQDEGIAGYIFPRQEYDTMSLYRLYSEQLGDHFYTTSRREAAEFIRRGYQSEGIAGYVFTHQVPGTTPLYQLNNPRVGDHFYTTRAVERARAIEYFNYVDEGEEDDVTIACYIYASEAVLTTVTDTRQVARQKGPMVATITEITVEHPIPPIDNLREIEVYELAGPEMIFRYRHYRYPQEGPSGGTVYVPSSQLESLEPKRTLVLDDLKADPQVVTVTGVDPEDADLDGDDDHLAISFTPPLARTLDTETAVLYGNVALATHGETVAREVLGSGDASAAFQSFDVRRAPVTFVPQPSAPRGAANTLEVRVGGVKWHEVPNLYGHGSDERVYTTSVDEDGSMRIQFGDGKTGARLPSGRDNVVATYRQGLGREGIVKPGSLKTLLDRPVGLRDVTNPAGAEGGVDRENLQEARSNALNTVRTFGRVVSLRDFEDAAREFVSVAKARAILVWDGGEQVVRLTVASQPGADAARTRADLATALDSRRDPNRKLDVAPYDPVPVQVKATVHVHPDHQAEAVLAAAQQALEEAFAFDRLELGQDINLSDTYRTLQDVDGVLWVSIERLQYKDQEDRDSHGVTDEEPVQARLQIEPWELAVIEDPATDAVISLEVGRS